MARSLRRCSVIMDLVQFLILFIKLKERSASALEIGNVHPINRRRWTLGNESILQALSAWTRLFGIAVCSLSLFNNILALHNPSHRLSSFGRDFGKGKSISHFNKLSKMLSGYMGVATSIDGTRLKRQWVWFVSYLPWIVPPSAHRDSPRKEWQQFFCSAPLGCYWECYFYSSVGWLFEEQIL